MYSNISRYSNIWNHINSMDVRNIFFATLSLSLMFWKGYFWVRYLEKLVAVYFSPICGFQEKKMKYEIFYKQQEFVYEYKSNNEIIEVFELSKNYTCVQALFCHWWSIHWCPCVYLIKVLLLSEKYFIIYIITINRSYRLYIINGQYYGWKFINWKSLSSYNDFAK